MFTLLEGFQPKYYY